MSVDGLFSFNEVAGARYRFDYGRICDDLNTAKMDGDAEAAKKIITAMSEADLFFFSYFVLNLFPLNHPWVLDRVYEVQDAHDGYLDLWSRGHYKSTIKTFCLPMWKIIRNPEARILFFSHTKAMAGVFQLRCKTEMEENRLLKTTWPHIFWANTDKSPTWNNRSGLQVQRMGNYIEPTISSWGLVERLPTGFHGTDLIYDDVVTGDTVSTNEQIEKAWDGYRNSLNLVADEYTLTVQGTYYHYDDPYVRMIREKMLHVREYPGTKDGTETGKPVYWTSSMIAKKRREMGEYIFSCQVLLRPIPKEQQKFKDEWLTNCYFKKLPKIFKCYMIVDPSSGRRKDKSDPDSTVMIIIGVDISNHRWLMYGIRDKLTMRQKWFKLRDITLRFRPYMIGYEKYGMQADRIYIEEMAEREGVLLPDIVDLGGVIPKRDRILNNLVPLFESSEFHIPESLMYEKISGERVDFIDEFRSEYLHWPQTAHDDILDAMARQNDEELDIRPPKLHTGMEYELEDKGPLFRKKESKRSKDYMAW